MFIPRDYQHKAHDCIYEEWKGNTSTLLVAPTGVGKTCIFAMVAQTAQPGRVMVLASRRELIYQACDKITKITGLECGVEMADSYASDGLFGRTQVVVSTVQTQCSDSGGRRRMGRHDPKEFSVLILDEAHEAVSPSFMDVINYYKTNNPNIKIMGCTATPDRSSEESLGQVFETVAFDYEILDAIHDGWLVPIEQQFVNISGLDFSAVKTTAGDLNGADLAAVMEAEKNMQGVAGATIDIVGDKRTLVFTASVKQAEMLAAIFNRHRNGMADWVCGATNKDKRKTMLSQYNDGKIQVMVNCNCLCLDHETEILTDTGWVGMDSISHDYRVANWDNGRVFFQAPKEVIKRDRLPGEQMVILETKNRSIRVTSNHRILHKAVHQGSYKVATAAEMVKKKAQLPISGMAPPEPMTAPYAKRSKAGFLRKLSVNSYMLRKGGMSAIDAHEEAWRRIERRDKLQYKNPHELTAEECELIGFWIGDGSVTKIKSGGVSYTMCQWDVCPNIIKRVDHLLKVCGIDCLKKRKETKNGSWVIEWAMSRGTGFGPQARRGVFHLEPYLNKSGSELWFGFNCEQFDAFVRGYWMADGCDHLDNIRTPKNIRICGARPELFSTIQAIACVRGYRVSLLKRSNRGFWIWFLSMTKKSAHAMTKYTMQFEVGWKPEKVWCVTTEAGTIITRRRGTVTVLGNSQGFDSPGVEVVVQARPTKSRSLYAQQCGRATRPLPGVVDGPPTSDLRKAAIAASKKPSCLIVDFVGNSGRHKLMTSADILGGKVSDDAIARAIIKAKKANTAVRMSDLLDESEEEIRLEAEARRQAEEARKARLVAKVSYSAKSINPFDVLQIAPVKERGWDSGRVLSEKQSAILLKAGVNPSALPYSQAKQLLNEIFSRWNKKLATLGQMKVLARYGYTDATISFDQASKTIDAIQKAGWRRPVETTK